MIKRLKCCYNTANLPKTHINYKSEDFKVNDGAVLVFGNFKVNTDEVHVVFLEAVQKNKASE